MFTAGLIVITLEIVLLLIWVYHIFFSSNKTDPAGKGIAMVFLIGLIAYIIGGIVLLLMRQTWSAIVVLLMATVPLAIVVIGLWKEYGTKRKTY